MHSTTARRGLAALAVAAAATMVPAGAAVAANHGPATPANSAAAAKPMLGPACRVGYLCVFDGPNYTGHRHDYYSCGSPVDVRDVGLSGVRSFVNNQTGNTASTFSYIDPTGNFLDRYRSVSVDAQSTMSDPVATIVKTC